MIALKFLNKQYKSLQELKNSYKDQCKIHHPDKGGATANFILLKNEYDFLANLHSEDILEFQLAPFFKFYKMINGKDIKVAYLKDIIGDGTIKSPFFGNVKCKYYKDWLIYYKNDQYR